MYARYGLDASWRLDAGLVEMVALVPVALIIAEVVLMAGQATWHLPAHFLSPVPCAIAQLDAPTFTLLKWESAVTFTQLG